MLELSPLSCNIEHVRGNFVQGKGCVRVLFDCPITEGIFAEVTSRYGDYCYMVSSDDDVFNYTKKNPSRTIVVKRLDSCPITEQAANVLSSFLKMTRVTRNYYYSSFRLVVFVVVSTNTHQGQNCRGGVTRGAAEPAVARSAEAAKREPRSEYECLRSTPYQQTRRAPMRLCRRTVR
jgi:hypothetical protein